MKLNKPQAEVLLHYMIEAAKAVAEDGTMYYDDERIAREFLGKAEEFLHEINELSE